MLFGATNEILWNEFVDLIQSQFKWENHDSLLGFRLSKQLMDLWFINKKVYILHSFWRNGKANDTPISTSTKLDANLKGKDVEA